MRNLALALSVLASGSAAAISNQEMKDIIARHCANPQIRCLPEYAADTVQGFTYAGNGHQDIFWLSKPDWEKYERETGAQWLPRRYSVAASSRPVGRPYIMAEQPYTRLDELETKKYRLNVMRGMCVGGFAGCSFAITKMVGFWPAFAASVTCASAAWTCELIAEDMVEEINKEIDAINAGGHTAAGSNSSGGATWVSEGNPHALPPLPPLPEGHVTIIDHPYIP